MSISITSRTPGCKHEAEDLGSFSCCPGGEGDEGSAVLDKMEIHGAQAYVNTQAHSSLRFGWVLT